MIDTVFVELTKTYNKEFGKNLTTYINYNPHQIYTNVAQLQNQQIHLKDRKLALIPPLEDIRLRSKSFFGFELEGIGDVKQVSLKLGGSENLPALRLEVSTNGSQWETIATKIKDSEFKVLVNNAVKYVRIVNSSEDNIEVRIIEFSAEIK